MGVTLEARFDEGEGGAAIAAIIAKAQDLLPLMTGIGALLEGSTRDRLRDTNLAPDGAAWPPSMRVQVEGGKTLYQSGQLAASITNLPGPDSVEIGSNMIYAGIHQTGGEIVPRNGGALMFALPGGGFATVGKVTMPARPYLGISESDRELIGDAVAFYLAPEATP